MKLVLGTTRLAQSAFGAAASIAILVAMVAVAQAQTDVVIDDTDLSRKTRCSNALLYGKYAVIGDGSVRFGGPTAPMVSFSTVSLLTMDGSGGLTNKVTRSVDGNITRIVDPGSYAINPDCTGTMTLGTLTFDVVIAEIERHRDARQFYFVATTPGGVVTARARRIE